MNRRWYSTALRDDDLRCRRKWTLAVTAFYVTVVGVLGAAAWLGAISSDVDMGQTAMAGRIIPPHVAALSFPSLLRETK
jgi:hypothetical protein